MQTSPHRVLSQFCAGMVSLHRTAKIALMGGIDLIASSLCFLASMLLRGDDLKPAAHYVPTSCLIAALATIAAFSMSDLYHAVICFIDGRLLSATGLAPGIAILCTYVVLFAINDAMFPRSALAIYWFIAFSYVVTSRIGMRNFLMMSCETHERGMIASRVKAIVSEYTPQLPVAAPAQQPEPEAESGKARLSLIRRFVPFRV